MMPRTENRVYRRCPLALATMTKALKPTHRAFPGLFGVSLETLWTYVGTMWASKYLKALGFLCGQFTL